MNQLRNQALIISKNAYNASKSFALISFEIRNQILSKVRDLIIRNTYEILNINKEDVRRAKLNQLSESKINRLILNENSIEKLIKSIDEIIKLPDPLGKISYDVARENGLHIQRISTPIGVLMAIYEARPNVTCDIASLAIKSGNVAILRSGSEAFETSKIIAQQFRNALKKFNIDENVISFCNNSDREFIKYLLKMDKYIDVIIPRGSKSLILAIAKQTRIPLFKHLDGNCHTYINEFADFEKARKIVFNAKLRRTEICGATESLLIDKKIAPKIIPLILEDLINAGCEIRGDQSSIKIDNRIKKASDKDYYLEYLDKIISLKIVENIDKAIIHINKYGSSHTESIITENKEMAKKFLIEVNSAIVMQNASTQFADGGEFGFGGEVGISTGKLHARGPVGVEQLTTHKYIIQSEFAIRK